MERIADFFAFANERQRILLRKEEPWPWTSDPILQYGRFCNVFREDDTHTRWFAKNIRDHATDEQAVLACVAFRWFNNVKAGVVLQPYLLGEEWNENVILVHMNCVGAMRGMMPNGGVATNAGILACIRPFVRLGTRIGLEAGLMRHVHQLLCSFDYLGPALAYEIVCDLRHTVLAGADDIDQWAYVAPTVCRGMGYVVSDDPLEYVFGHERTDRVMLSLMRSLLDESRTQWQFQPWELSEVETVLHEFNKYRTAQNGGPFPRKFQCQTN